MNVLKITSGGGVWLKSLFMLCLLAWGARPALALEGMIGIHDPSTVIECDGKYYVYGTGRGISVLTSTNAFDWQRGSRVFDRIPDSVLTYVPKNDGAGVWAPDVIQINGKFYLYYAVSSWGSYVSAVGLMTSPTLDPANPNYKWTDCGMIVHSSEGENLNAIDPGVCLAPDGTLWLCYGSYHGTIDLVQLDPQTGLRLDTNAPVSIISSQSEASDIIFHKGFYYLFVNHGGCCQGTNSSYNIRVGRSQKVTGPYLDRDGEDLVYGGGTLFLAAQGKDIGPGHFGLLKVDGVEKFSCHYEAVLGRAGRSVLDIRPLLWTLDGWPMPGDNVTDGVYQIRSQRTGTILQVSSDTSANESPVKTARYLVRDNQKWTVTPAGGGFYKIVNVQSGNCLAVDGTNLNTASFTGADSQLWGMDQLEDGSYRIAAKLNQLALTALIQDKPGNGVGIQSFTGGNSQRWIITEP